MEDTTEKVEEVGGETEATPTSEETQNEDIKVLAEDAVEGGPDSTELSPQKVPQKKDGSREQKRIGDLIRDRSQRDALIYQKDLRISELEAEQVKRIDSESEIPKIDDFKDNDEYQKALSDWTVSRMEKKRFVQAEQAKRQAQVDAASSAANPFWDKTGKLNGEDQQDVYSAYGKLVDPATSTSVLSNSVQNYLMQSGVGPELLIHLARHDDMALKLSGMDIYQVTRELDSISGNIETANTSRQLTSAPSPITPVDEVGVGSTKDWDKMGADELESEMKKQGLLST